MFFRRTTTFIMALMLVIGCAACGDDENGAEGDNGSDWQTDAFAIGDAGPAGGTIFYVDETDAHEWSFLELAPEQTQWTNKPWGPISEDEIGADAQGEDIGDGASNTAAIVAAYGEEIDGIDDYAAKLADELVHEHDGEVFDDWFLPSLQEVIALFDELQSQDLGDLSESVHWSSTEDHDSNARMLDLRTGNGASGDKTTSNRVRAIRAF